jgi:hypothetical protein
MVSGAAIVASLAARLQQRQFRIATSVLRAMA